MNSHKSRLSILLALLLARGMASAHTDLELQIEDLSRQIEASGPDTSLLLRRADLYRRHLNWRAAASDFARVRELEPGNPLVDWVEGRYRLDSGQLDDAELLLTRFLESNPGHSGAYQARATTRWRQGKPAPSASDFVAAIENSERPGPSLYRALVIAHFASGDAALPEAVAAVNSGLGRFPREVNLLGLGTDLFLLQNDFQPALTYMSRVPQRLYDLPQWRFRSAVWACLQGDEAKAAEIFSELHSQAGQTVRVRAGTWTLPLGATSPLMENPKPNDCSAAVRETLDGLQP